MQGEGRENIKAGIGYAKNFYSFNAFVFSFSVPSLSLLSILVFSGWW
jgi:hypothetical protein